MPELSGKRDLPRKGYACFLVLKCSFRRTLIANSMDFAGKWIRCNEMTHLSKAYAIHFNSFVVNLKRYGNYANGQSDLK